MTVRILEGDCRDSMRALIAAGTKVQTIVTSPPYFGLRDYGHADQIGLEASPAEFIAQLVDVFDVARELLADDGTLWVNMGDSYAGGGGFSPGSPSNQAKSKQTTHKGSIGGRIGTPSGLKPKDLIGIPWRLAFALQAAGWYLRQDIIWSKPNPMPESMTDRCTKAHEYLFLLSKSPRYYFDAAAIAEPLGESSIGRLSQPGLADQIGSDRVPGKTNGTMKAVGTRRPPGNINPQKGEIAYAAGDERHRTKAGLTDFAGREREKVAAGDLVGTRNKRSVWTVATQPFSEAHFATFPPALIEPCILAGSRQGDIVLDPFGGAGTTRLVADRNGRSAILCELNPDYAAMARRRIYNDAPLFAEVM